MVNCNCVGKETFLVHITAGKTSYFSEDNQLLTFIEYKTQNVKSSVANRWGNIVINKDSLQVYIIILLKC